MSHILCQVIGTYQVIRRIWMKTVIFGSEGRIDDVIMTAGERVVHLK